MATKTLSERASEIEGKIALLPDVESDAARESAKRRRLVNELLLLQVWAAQISECLVKQREAAERNPRLSRFPHVSPSVLKDRISRKTSNRFYNVQKAFSLPSDYLSLPDGPIPESWETQAILDSVVHPELVPSEFLASLGFALPDAKSSKTTSYVREIEAKIALIPKLKETLANSKPIAKTSKGNSKAFALLWHPDAPDGRIVAFQDSNGRETKRKNALSTHVKTYSDAFSYLRSRYYAADFLSEREVALKESAASLSSLIVRFDGTPEDGTEVARLREALASRKTFFEQRAFLDRLLGVELRNRSQDRLRMKGALADVQQAFLERMGKRLSMETQAKAIEASIEAENAAWKALYGALKSAISNTDAIEGARRTSRTLKAYELSAGDFPVKPFSSLRTSLRSASEKIATCLTDGNPKSARSALRDLDCLLRSHAFWLFCFWTEHAFKTDAVLDGKHWGEKLSIAIDRKIAKIESMVFGGLDDAATNSPRFSGYRLKISEMRRLSDIGDYRWFVDYLESVRTAA